MIKNPRRPALLAKAREHLPREPGIYRFFDHEGKILYIGKSKNLRQRVSTYFQGNGSGLESRTRRMIFQIDDFDCEVTGSELSALLLEDGLIKRHHPLYNVRQREYGGYRYIVVTDDRFPALKVVDRTAPQAAGRLFGPFRDRYFAEKLLDNVHLLFGLRHCGEAEPAQRCFRREIGRCSGPCMGKVSADDYAQDLARAEAFLKGDASLARRLLEQTIEEHAEHLRFEQAAEDKERLAFIDRFCQRQRFIHEFRKGKLVLVEAEPASRTHLFLRGRYEALVGTPPATEINGRFSTMEHAPPSPLEDERFLLDRANIVYTWMKKNQDACSLRILP